LARDVRASGADVVHSPAIDFVSLRPGAPLVVTVHDLAPLKSPTRYLRTGAKHRLRYAAVRRATRVITPSGVVAGDCERMLGIARDRIAVVPEAAAPVFRRRDDARALLARLTLPERFMVWAGGLDPPDPRKGIERLVAEVAARADGLPLVLAGRIGIAAADLARPERVQLVGRLDDDELAALYSLASVMVFPSEDEGFGLPAVEALACGTPVAAFAIPALEEALADSAGVRLVPAGDYGALLTAAADLAGATATAPRRTWSDVARETIAVYEDARGRAST
jgi:glycosyltransferase involved in cell wall biosynthesis